MKGFTLMEVMLSIAIIAILAGLSAPVYQRLQLRNELSIATNASVQTLRRAQVLSQAVEGDSTWGVKVQSGSIVIFKGASYLSRDTTFDESFSIPENIATSGISEIVFSKLQAVPATTGTLTLTADNNSQGITINSKGMIEY